MALEEELKLHPRGQISCEGSQLMQATMGRFSFTNGAQLKHTLAKSPNGYVLGPRDCNGSVDIDVAEDGLEQDWIGLVRSGQKVAFQYELPTLNVEIAGVLSGVEGELTIENGTKITISWIGAMGVPVGTT